MKKQPKKHAVLTALYSTTDNQTITRETKTIHQWVYGLVGLCVTIIGISTYIILQTRTFDDQTIIISIDTKPMITSGMPTEVTIHYTNNQNLPLSNAELSLKFPKGFVFTSSTPETDIPLTFPLGTLTDHKAGVITVAGVYTGSLDSAEQIRSTFTYRPANFNADFQKITTEGIRSTELPFSVAFTPVDHTTTLTSTTYALVYTPVTTSTTRTVQFTIPESFVVTSSTPVLIENAITLSNTNKPQTITLTGMFNGGALGDQTIKATIGNVVNTTFIPETTIETKTTVMKPALSLTTLINNTEKPTLASGETINVLATVTNNGILEQKNATLNVELVAPIVNHQSVLLLDTLKTNKALSITVVPITQNLEKITITTKPTLASLSSIKPGETKTVMFNIPVDTFSDSVTPPILLTPSLAYGKEHVATTPLSIPWRANTNVTALIIPNTTIEKTVASDGVTEITRKQYAGSWTITNPLHDLEDVEIIISLPTGVTAGIGTQPKVGTLEYIPSTNILRYTTNKFPTSIKTLGFDATLYTNTFTGDPETAQLATKTTLTATDTTTLEPFSQSFPATARP